MNLRGNLRHCIVLFTRTLIIFQLVILIAKGQGEEGLATKYPGDHGIENDPAVLFTENFESGGFQNWDRVRGGAKVTGHNPNSGNSCAEMPMVRGKGTGSDAIKWFMPGSDVVYARFYVKFSADYQYCHHFVWLG